MQTRELANRINFLVLLSRFTRVTDCDCNLLIAVKKLFASLRHLDSKAKFFCCSSRRFYLIYYF